MTVTRREFLRTSSLFAGAVLLGPRVSWGSDTDLDPAPFEYGVASADPTADGVVLWTRVSEPVTHLTWEVAIPSDGPGPDFSPGLVVASGSAPVLPDGDGTVLVDVTGLPVPGQHYWYRFRTPVGATSITGRTKTAPAPGSLDPVRLAIASCQDFQAGYYHAWRSIAMRPDLDAVIFLGDYIYEYSVGDGSRHVRSHDPEHETITLDDYRRRYRTYRSDRWLRAAHAMHPFITVWDDHEVANDRWSIPGPGGAENHQPDSEGDYGARLDGAMKAFFEYIPVRRPDPVGEPWRIYRALAFGALADLNMLDTRSYRNQALGSLNANLDPTANLNPGLSDPDRTILGSAQKAWLKDRLATSSARWKLIGNQVMASHLNVIGLPDVLAAPVSEATGEPLPAKVHRDGLPINSDQWDGYKVEHREMMEFLAKPSGDLGPTDRALGYPDRIRNVVFLTGDIHISWVFETVVNPGDAPTEQPVAVEFVGPGISSINLNERLGELMRFGGPLPHGISRPVVPAAMALNRHLRWADLDANGYVVISIDTERVRADYHLVENPPFDLVSNPVENPDAVVGLAPGGSWQTFDGTSRVVPAL